MIEECKADIYNEMRRWRYVPKLNNSAIFIVGGNLWDTWIQTSGLLFFEIQISTRLHKNQFVSDLERISDCQPEFLL